MKDYDRLPKGKRVFITIGVRGIGRGIALLLVQQGVQVGIGGRDPEPLAKTMEEIRACSPEGKGYVAEPSSKEQMGQTADRVLEDMQGVDTFVNIVGVNIYERIDEYSDEPLERMLETNRKSGLRFPRKFIPGMMERRYGITINISSVHSVATMPGLRVYIGIKGAINAIARVMALDYADHGIRVSIIYPRLIMSNNMTDEAYGYQEDLGRDAFMEMLNHMRPLAPGEMEDISDVVLCLANDMPSHVTGQAIVVDGGASTEAYQRGREDELS